MCELLDVFRRIFVDIFHIFCKWHFEGCWAIEVAARFTLYDRSRKRVVELCWITLINEFRTSIKNFVLRFACLCNVYRNRYDTCLCYGCIYIIHRYWHDTIHRYYVNTKKIFSAVHYLIIFDTVLQISNIIAYTASDYIRYTNSDYDVESRWKSKFQHQCLFWFFDNL